MVKDKIWLLLLAIWLGCANLSPLPLAMAANEETGDFAAGSGTEDDPYIIETREQLYALSEHQQANHNEYLIAHLQLVEDIHFADWDWDANPWEPIGTNDFPFTGVFDGNGYVIRGLKVDMTGNFVGMFGVIGAEGIVQNVTLQKANITGSRIVGALVGGNHGKVKASSASGQIVGKNGVGGLIGSNYASVDASYATSSVSGEVQVGGLVGYNSGTIQTSHATGNVDGSYIVGGLVGHNELGTVQASYAAGRVSGSSVGGLAGQNMGTVHTSYATGEVTGSQPVGGLVGYNDDTVQTSYWNLDAVSEGMEGIGSGSGDATGLTEEQMQDKNNFPDFDFDTTWSIQDGGMPYLKPVVIGADGVDSINVPLGTSFKQIPLPSRLNIKLSDGETLKNVDVDWDVADNPGYDPNVARTFLITGTVKLDDVEEVGAHSGNTISIKVAVIEDQSNHTGRLYVNASGGDDTNDGSSWDQAFATLQQALDVADASGGVTNEIWIAKGTYIPTGNEVEDDPRTVHFEMKNNVSIFGGFAGIEDAETFDLAERDLIANETILSGKIGQGDDDSDHAYHVFYHDGGVDQTAVLDGVTIAGGRANGVKSIHQNGAGMVNYSSSPTLTNVTIRANTSSTYGYGGGIANYSSHPILMRATIIQNTSPFGNGGGIYNYNSNPVLNDVTISENSAAFGGGMYNQFNSSPTLINGTISGNTASSNGGGMYNLSYSRPLLTNVIITGNTADSGGGIFNDKSGPVLTNVTISGNVAVINGGGMRNYDSSETTIHNSLIWGNGLQNGSENNIVNTDNFFDPTIEFSLIGGPDGESPEEIDIDSVTVGLLFRAPVPFHEAPTTDGDYHLKHGSPAINAGSNSKVPGDITTDRDGNPRIMGGRVDLGAYEYQDDAPEPPVASQIEIFGTDTITIPTSGKQAVTTTYTAVVKDQNGDEMPGEAVTWSVTSTAGVSMDSDAGILTITSQASQGSVIVKATLVDDTTISGDTSITLKAGAVEPPKRDTEAPKWRDGDEVTVSDITQMSVKLSWPMAMDNVGVTGYRIYVDDEETTTVTGSTHAFAFDDLQAGTEYVFKVTAYDAAGNESAPLTASAKTLPELPEPVAEAPQWQDGDQLTISNITQTSVKLSWPIATDKVGVTGYRVFVDNDEWNPKTVSENVYEYTVTGLHSSTTYTFFVKAFNDAGKESKPLSKQATTARLSSGGGGSSGGGSERASNNTDLMDLEVRVNGKKLELWPSFSSSTTDYTVRTEAERVEIVAQEAHSGAKVILNNKVTTEKMKIDLAEGENTIELTVQAENGTTKKYTLTIYRETPRPSEPFVEFSDIAGHWAESSIKIAAANRFVSGYPDGTFRPNNAVTRAEFTVMLVDALKLKGTGATLPFTDNDQIDGWAQQAIALAVQVGMVNGDDKGNFHPKAHITRAQMAVMIARAMQLQLNDHASTSFSDDGTIPLWAKGAVEAIRKLGIVDGRGENHFASNEWATRAEASVILLRVLEHKEEE